MALILCLFLWEANDAHAYNPSAPLARTDVSEVTVERLNDRILLEQPLEEDLEKAAVRQLYMEKVRELAIEDILIHLLEVRTYPDEEQWRGTAEAQVRRALAERGRGLLILIPPQELTQPDSELANERINQALAAFEPEILATWRHIYIKSESQEEKLQQLQKALEKESPDFPALVAQFSEEPDATADQRFGPMRYRGAILPALAETLDRLEPGEISDPLRTAVGIFVVQLVARKESDPPSRNEVRRRVMRELTIDQQEGQREEKREKLRASLEIQRGTPEGDAPYLRVGTIVMTRSDVRYSTPALPAHLQPLAETNLYAPPLMDYLEEQLLYIRAVEDIEGPAVLARIARGERRSVLAQALMTYLTEQSVSGVSKKELRELYEEKAATSETVIVGEVINLPAPLTREMGGSVLVEKQREWLRELRNEWKESGLSGQELLRKSLPENSGAQAEQWEHRRLSEIYNRFQPILQTMWQEGKKFSEPVPVMGGWAVLRLERSYEGTPPYRVEKERLQRELQARKQRKARDELSEKLLKEYHFRLLAEPTDFYWDHAAGRVGIRK